MKKLILIVSILLFTSNIFAQNLTVAVAANVQFAMKEIKTSFEKQSGIKLSTVIGSSGKLTAQIENGAPFDVFLSADMKYPSTLYKKSFAVDSPKIYAQGALVLWTLDDVNLKDGIKALTSSSIKKIALANPMTAPYGRESVRLLKYYKLYKKLKSKLVYGSSIAQTNQYIVSKAAQIGFTAKSVVLSPEMKNKGEWIDLNSKAYSPIAQGAVILKHGNETLEKESKEFYNFLFSKTAKQIFKKYGYRIK